MLLPRPETRMATRFGSRIVGDGPVLGRVPGTRLAAHGAAAMPLLDAANLGCAVERGGNSLRKAGFDDHRHADPAVKRSRHFLGSDPPASLQQGKDRRQFPTTDIYHRMAIFG